MITFKSINQLYEVNKKQYYLAYSILSVATENGKLTRVGEKRYNKAKKLVMTIKKLNRLVDWELHAEENEFTYDKLVHSGQYQRKQAEQERVYQQAKKLANELNILILNSTFYYPATKEKRQIYISY